MRHESCEVAVAGNPGAAFGNCKRRVLSVRDQFSRCRNDAAQFQHALQVTGIRDDHAALRLCAYLLDCRNRNLRWSWRCVYAGIRDDPYEPDRNQYAERERLRSVDHVFKPAAMSRVGPFVCTMRVHEEVYVRHQQGSSPASA